MSTKEELGPFDKQFIEFCEKYPEAIYMLRQAAKTLSTKALYSRGVFLLSEFYHKTPTEIVAEYQADVKRSLYDGCDKWEKIFKDFAIFLEDKEFSSATVGIYYVGAKALLNYNVPRSMRLQTKGPEIISREIPGVTFDDLRQLYALSKSPRDRACLSILKDCGISAADAIRLKFKDLKGFGKGEEWIQIDTVREKEHVNYTTFLGPNGAADLRAYVTYRQQRGEQITPDSFVFVSEHKPYLVMDTAALACVFTRMTARTGIEVSTHRLRKFFETYEALVVRHPLILKYWMGHKVKHGRDIESRYIIPPVPEQLALYKQAYPKIDVTGGSLEERARQAAKEEFQAMLSPEQKEFIQSHPEIRFRRKKEAKEKEKECEDGEHCGEEFKQISETLLLEHLKDGWRITHNLGNGQVIVQK
jgi:integrase